MFLMIFTFSFVSNTNALCPMCIEQDVVREAQEAAWELYDEESPRALEVFGNGPVFQCATAGNLSALRQEFCPRRNDGSH